MLSLVNDFGTMGLREKLDGEWWCTLNMKVYGEDGVLVNQLGHMRWDNEEY